MFWFKRSMGLLLGCVFMWLGIYVWDFAFATTLINKILVFSFIGSGVILILAEIIRISSRNKRKEDSTHV